jgi:hypothetical protein
VEEGAVDITGMTNDELRQLQYQYGQEHPNPYTKELTRREKESEKDRIRRNREQREAWELSHDTADADACGLSLEKYREAKERAIDTWSEWIELYG